AERGVGAPRSRLGGTDGGGGGQPGELLHSDTRDGGGPGGAGGSSGATARGGEAGAGGVSPSPPELRLTLGAEDVPCGAARDLGAVAVGLAAPLVRFELHNDGGMALHLLGEPPIVITTEDRGEVAAAALPAVTLDPGASSALELLFTPHRTGARFATVTLDSDDPDQPTCTIQLRGSGLPVAGPDIDAWIETASFDTGRFNLGVAVHDRHLYLVGGANQGLFGREVLADVQVATLNGDGTVGAWVNATALPAPVVDAAVFAYDGFLFVTGGEVDADGTQTDAVWSAPLGADGAVGAWSSATSLPEPRDGASAVVYHDVVYLVGGRGASGVADQVHRARLGPGGAIGPWEATSPLLREHVDLGVAVVGEQLYALGGWDAGGVLETERTAIGADGTLGAWAYTTPLPGVRSSGMGLAYGDHVYLVSGDNGTITGMQRDGVFAAVGPDGALGAWSTLGHDYAGGRTGAGVVVYDGWLYVLGGWDQLLTNYDDVQAAPFR
ncbi:MAG TPA: hypothetical protein PLU22_11415, partial [Polyangiaceae bacterium]|nr:hypothetical protein [Polyangiaceae bacterium]